MDTDRCSPSPPNADITPAQPPGRDDAAPIEAPPFDVVPAVNSDCGLIFICDHASNHIPPRYQGLGLGLDQLQRHIAYDPGAAAVTKVLAAHFGATAILTNFSRLLIDPNRGEDDPTLVMRIADGAVVPGNRVLDAAEVTARLETFYRPYHEAVRQAIDAHCQRNLTPVIVSVHSFTEAWKGVPRPWHLGILWDNDPRIAVPLIDYLRQDHDLIIGDNEPYSGELEGDTLWRHATQRRLPHALIEVRQDLIRDEFGQQAWSARLARALEQTLARYQADLETTMAAQRGT